MTENERALGDAVNAALAPTELAEQLADVALAMKVALENRGFGTAISEQTGVQFMTMLAATSRLGGAVT